MDPWQRAIQDVIAGFKQQVAKGDTTRDRASLVRYVDAVWRPQFHQIEKAVAPRTDHELVQSVIAQLGL